MLLIPMDSDQAYRIMQTLPDSIDNSSVLGVWVKHPWDPDYFAGIIFNGFQSSEIKYKDLKQVSISVRPFDSNRPIDPEKIAEYYSDKIEEAYYQALKEYNVREADLLVVYSNHYLACFLLVK